MKEYKAALFLLLTVLAAFFPWLVFWITYSREESQSFSQLYSLLSNNSVAITSSVDILLTVLVCFFAIALSSQPKKTKVFSILLMLCSTAGAGIALFFYLKERNAQAANKHNGDVFL